MRDADSMGSVLPLVLIGSIVLVSMLALSSPKLMSTLILSPHRVRERRELYRLVTAAWIHADVGHLFFNMFTLYFFAAQVVRAMGSIRFLLLYLTAAVVAHIPSVLKHMHDPRYASLGASGAVAAVTFSAVLLYPGMKLSLLFLPIPIPGVLYAIGYLAYSAWQARRAGSGVNHDAHFAGALYGAVATFALEPSRVLRTLHALLPG